MGDEPGLMVVVVVVVVGDGVDGGICGDGVTDTVGLGVNTGVPGDELLVVRLLLVATSGSRATTCRRRSSTPSSRVRMRA